MSELRVAVVVEREEPELRAVARAVERALGPAAEATSAEEAPREGGRAPIALPLGASEPPPRLRDASIAVVLDAGADELAREAGVEHRVALLPRYAIDWDGPLDAQLVLVAHEALIDAAVKRGASRRRVRVVGPVAEDDFSAPGQASAAEARAALSIRDETPCVVVRGAALDRDELGPTLVQLSLARGEVSWLFDVGGDPELARVLRRAVPGYGLDARMFADGPEAAGAYRAADAVLGRIEGPEAVRAALAGATFVAFSPYGDQLGLAHALERGGGVEFIDALATLAVTLDAVLKRDAREGARAASAAGASGLERVVEAVRELSRGELGLAPPSGLPIGLERLDARDEPRRAAPEAKGTDLDRSVDAELAALRAKLGL